MINGEANVQCCKCKRKQNELELLRVKDEESSKKWGTMTYKDICPYCGHDEYYRLENY